jgi:hypothetical protein
MQDETRKVMWFVFAIGVLTFAAIPEAWGMFSHSAATGSVKDASMANALWGQQRQITAYTQSWSNDTNTASIPGAVESVIQQVTWDTSVWPPKLTLTGYGFGNPPSQGQPLIQIGDTSRGWMASTLGSAVQPHIAEWQNNKIVIDGFSNYGSGDVGNWSNGLGSWVFARGDYIKISITNPQSGTVGSTIVTYPNDAPMPTVAMNVPNNIIGGIQTTISGTVTFNGQPLANQAVALSVSHGSLAGGGGQQATPTEYMLSTDGQGQWSVNYTPPLPGGTTETITAMADSMSTTQSLTILPAFKVTLTATANQNDNNVTLQAVVNYPLNGFTLEIINQTTGQVVASTTQGTTLTTVITAVENQTQTYIAQIN